MDKSRQPTESETSPGVTPVKFWGTIVANTLASLLIAYYLINLSGRPASFIGYFAIGLFFFLLATAIFSIILTIRGHQEQGVKTGFYAGLATSITVAAVFQGRTLSASVSYLVIGLVLIFWLLPEKSKHRNILILGAGELLIWVLEWINPPWRITSEAATFGPVTAIILGIILVVLVVRQAWGGNIRVKLVTSFTVIALISVAIVGTVVYFSYRNQVREDIRQRLLNIVTITALRLDGDLHATLQTPEDMQTDAYRQLMAEGDAIIATDPDLIFSYTMRLNEQGQIYFVIDSRRADDTERDPIGTIYDEPSETLQAFFNAPDRPIVEEEIYTDKYGSVLSAFAPFYRADGSLEGIFGIDIAADAVLKQERDVLYLILGTTLGTMVLVTLFGLFLGNLFVGPVINLSTVAKKIIEGDLSARAKVETNDEVGELAKNFNLMTSQLQETLQGLELRVADRTRGLELAAEVGRSISQVRDLDSMLRDAAEIVRTRFDLYYTQVYLLNPAKDTLLLQAGTGTVGQELMGRGHSLPLNTGSINGRAVIEKHSIVIADTETSDTFRPNLLLPDTRSEMAVPLMVGETVVGVLDMQSARVGALNEDTLPAFEALAGQLAVAIQNANLLAETEQARTELELQARRLVRANWKEYLDAIHKPENLGFVYEGKEVVPVVETMAIDPSFEENVISAPISLAGETFGMLRVEIDSQAGNSRNAELVNIVARQVAQQIENLRILDSAERYRFEAEEASRRLTREGWKGYVESRPDVNLSYLYDLNEVQPHLAEGDGQLGGSAATIPIKVRDEKIGKLIIKDLETDNQESLELANQVAERLAAHIETLRQFDQTQSALSQSEKLFEASRVLTQAIDLQELIASTVKMMDIPEIDRAVMIAFNYDNQDTLEGLDVIANWWSGTGREVTPVGMHYSREAFQDMRLFISPEPVFFGNIFTDIRSTDEARGLATKLGLVAIAVLPLHVGAHQIGALVLEAETAHVFTNDETRLFVALAPQIATVLENRRQFEHARQQAERESMLNAISQKIQGATSVEAVLQIAARELGRALNAPMTIAQLGMKDRQGS